MAEGLLSGFARVLAGAFVAAVLVFFGHGLWVALFDRWAAPRLARARTALYGLGLEQGDHTAAAVALNRLPVRLRVRLLVELARSLEGEGRAFLARLAGETGVLRRAERMAGSRRWWVRLKGARLLTALGGNEILALSLLRDPHPAVRAQAAEWAAQHPTREVMRALLVLLEEPAALCRFSVQDALLRTGGPAVEPLAAWLRTARGPALLAALDVAIGMPQPPFTAPAVALAEHADARVRARAVALLAGIGGSDGVEAVEARLRDDRAEVRAAAARALGRLGHWPAASALAALLRDPAWEVRRAAGLALRGLGSPGTLLLRRIVMDHNLFAADMARQVLDLPSAAVHA